MIGYYLVDSPRSGPANMASDQFMLERSAKEHIPLVRFYQWQRPTLSLGYFQKFADRLQHSSSQHIDLVRRATGGGAIVHHFDWTYAVSVPNTMLAGSKFNSNNLGASQQLYDCVHGAVVAWLGEQGWNARQWDANCAPPHADANLGCSFLCFERRSRGDIVIGHSKVMGSAQRRSAGALLQHGSLLLQQSPHAPSLPGLRELANESAVNQGGSSSDDEHLLHTVTGFREQILQALEELLTVPFEPYLSSAELLPNVDIDGDTPFLAAKWTRRL